MCHGLPLRDSPARSPVQLLVCMVLPLSRPVLGTVRASRSTPQRVTKGSPTMHTASTTTSTCHGTRRAASFHRRASILQLARAAAATIEGRTPRAAPDLGAVVRQAAEALHRAGRAVAVHSLDRSECRRLRVPEGTTGPAIYVHSVAGAEVEWSDCWDDGDCLHIRAFGLWAEVHHTARQQDSATATA